ncbi:hypothetical protein [Magnetococcus sp. PR-3]|uniref:hypothetical protein n=1 Tax=Magnetococcus sp. PR-3 TaxID=3120355 RepID=UPI002FCDF983
MSRVMPIDHLPLLDMALAQQTAMLHNIHKAKGSVNKNPADYTTIIKPVQEHMDAQIIADHLDSAFFR